ncbi:MAG: hypothetical protein RR009_06835 [Oscillospiraceae bacterium]
MMSKINRKDLTAMLIYYISTPKYYDTFDKYFSVNMWAEKYSASDVSSLARFAVSERALRDAKHLIVNMKESHFTAFDVLECAKRLREYSSCKLTVIGDDTEDFRELIIALAEMNIRNTIIFSKTSSFDEVLFELSECLSENGKSFSSSLSSLNDAQLECTKSSILPSLKLQVGIRIGVAGAMPRIGTTWQAIGICDYLSFMGNQPLLVDMQGNLLTSLRDIYDIKADKFDVLSMGSLNVSPYIAENFSSHVIDLGVLTEDNLHDFEQCHVKILVCGSAPWELSHSAEAVNSGVSNDTLLFFSFTEQSTLNELKELPFMNGFTALCVPLQNGLWFRSDKSFYNLGLYPVLNNFIV